MLKERVYAWYPQVDVPEFTRAKQNSHEIDLLYHATNHRYLKKERPQDNEVPPIGFRINRKSVIEEEKELSPAGFLRRCKSAPLGLQAYEEASPQDYVDPKLETKQVSAVPNEEQPVNPHFQSTNAHTVVVNSECSTTPKQTLVSSQSPSPRSYSAAGNFDPKSLPKARPFSASFAMRKKSETEQCNRRISSSRAIRPANASTTEIAPGTDKAKHTSSLNYRWPCKHPTVPNFGPNSFLKVRPFSASFTTRKKTERGQCFHKVSSAENNRQIEIEPPTNIVVTRPVLTDRNGDHHTCLISRSSPKSPAQSQNSSNSDLVGQRNSLTKILASYPYRQRTASADGHSRGFKQNVDINTTTKISSSKPKILESSNQQTPTQDETRITEAQNPPSRQQNGNGLQDENQVLHSTGDDKGNRVNNRARNAWNKSSRTPEVNARASEVNDGKSAYTKRAAINETAIKEAKEYNRNDYNKDLRINGWRMEIHGNKFGLKKTPVRLPYWVPMAVPNVPEQSPVFHPITSNTLFYNTIPKRAREMTISKNWHSETGYEQRLANTNRKKQDYHYRNWSFAY